MDKYEIIDEYLILDYLSKGYEIVHSYVQWQDNSRYVNGEFMGNPVNINNFPSVTGNNKFIVKRTPQATVLFGEKNNDNSGS